MKLSLVGAELYFNERLKEFWQFLHERQVIWYRRTILQQPPPWSTDHTFQSQHIANVYRQLDPLTSILQEDVLRSEQSDQAVIFNVLLYRMLSNVESYSSLGGWIDLEKFDAGSLATDLKEYQDRSGKSPLSRRHSCGIRGGRGKGNKIVGVAGAFGEIYDQLGSLTDAVRRAKTPQELHAVIRGCPGFGVLLGYQATLDLCSYFNRVERLRFKSNQLLRFCPPVVDPVINSVELLTGEPGKSSLWPFLTKLVRLQKTAFHDLGLEFFWLPFPEGDPPQWMTIHDFWQSLHEFAIYRKAKYSLSGVPRTFWPSATS